MRNLSGDVFSRRSLALANDDAEGGGVITKAIKATAEGRAIPKAFA